MKNEKQVLELLINYILQNLIILYFVLLLVGLIWENSVSMYFNINYLVLFIIFFGVIFLLNKQTADKIEKIKPYKIFLNLIIGIISLIIVYIKVKSFNLIGILIVLILFYLLFLTFYILHMNDRKRKHSIKENIITFPLFNFIYILIVPTILLIIAIFTTKLSDFTFLESLRIVFSSFYIFILPGFILTYVFFPVSVTIAKHNLDLIERFALCIPISISVISIFTFLMYLFGFKISILETIIIVTTIIIVSLILLVKANNIKFYKYKEYLRKLKYVILRRK